LLAYDTKTRAHLLRALAARLGKRPGRVGTCVALEFIDTAISGRGIDLGGGITIRREFDRLVFQRPASRHPAVDESLPLPGAGSGVGAVRIAGEIWQVGWSRGTADDGLSEAEHIACFVPSQLAFPLAVRGWRPGDRIRLPGGTRKLKKLFVDRRVGRWDRAKLPLLVDGQEEVLWVVGLAKGTQAVPCDGDGLLCVSFRRMR
jgi:tRNA(Ile)-lysidine synthetase-like protein